MRKRRPLQLPLRLPPAVPPPLQLEMLAQERRAHEVRIEEGLRAAAAQAK